MNELRALLFLELRALYGINKLRHTKDPKTKRRYRIQCAAVALIIVVVCSYVGGLVFGLCSLGLQQIVPAYLTVLASVVILAFGIFKAGSRIFGQQGYDLLASMPVRSRNLVFSRFLSMYIEDLILTLVILIPGGVAYGLCARPQWYFYPVALLGAVLIPAIPLVISTLLGTFVMAVSAHMKRKSMVQTMLMVLFVLGVMAGSFAMGGMAESLSPEMLKDLAVTLGGLFEKLYPPALWLGAAMAEGNVPGFALFAAVSLAAMALTVAVVSRYFHAILGRLLRLRAKHNYKIGELEHRGLLKALYVREVKRYFSFGIYVTNTIIGPIMGTVMAVALCIAGADTLTDAIPGLDVPALLPFAFSAVFCMMVTTATSISMEGRQFWVIKSLPIPTKTLLDSKILLNLSLMLPFFVISAAAMAIAVKPDALQLLWLVLIPAVTALFCVVFGITVNLKFHSFDWEKEETVVKQSLPAALGGFAGFFISAVLGAGLLLVPKAYADAAKGLACLTLLTGAALLYRKNNRAVLSCL